jgi:hypothetical protein
MTAGDSNSAQIVSGADRDLMKRLTIVLALIFAFTAAFTHLERTYSRKFYDITGDARWIWAQHRMSDNLPVAFFAARDFTLPEKRFYAHLKVLGDPEYTVFVNGREIAGRRVAGTRGREEQRVLDLYDISPIAKTGRNRIVIAVRAPQGAGGLIASIDIGPETANWVVTDGSWRIFRRWDPRILLGDPPGTPSEPPSIIGAPPVGRWNYLATQARPLASPPAQITPPSDVFAQMGVIPRVRMAGGVAVAGREEARATVFDFGFTKGRVRIIDETDRIVSEVVHIRFAFDRAELGFAEWNLRPVVFAPGERIVTTPEEHEFRYVMLFGKGARAELVTGDGGRG